MGKQEKAEKAKGGHTFVAYWNAAVPANVVVLAAAGVATAYGARKFAESRGYESLAAGWTELIGAGIFVIAGKLVYWLVAPEADKDYKPVLVGDVNKLVDKATGEITDKAVTAALEQIEAISETLELEDVKKALEAVGDIESLAKDVRGLRRDLKTRVPAKKKAAHR